MGYNLAIGQAVVDWSEDYIRVEVEHVELPDAPAFGEPTDRTNTRWPSYTQWANFCEAIGIKDVMFNDRNGGSDHFKVDGDTWLSCLMPEHPGVAPITQHHVDIIEANVASYREKHPDHIAEYAPLKPGVEKSGFNREEDFVQDPRFDGNLCRAEWLLFWMRWALKNCDKPTFFNS